jgi:uncharacterized protein involved in response to NO
MPAIPRLRSFSGPAILSYGFRPFFLFGAFYAGAAVLLWLPMFEGRLAVTSVFAADDWHVHEMLYGYVAAVVTGFLLTAIPNWTGRLPLNGVPLLVLVLVWVAGRLAVAYSGAIGWLGAAVIDVAFLLLVLAAAAREIVAGRNWRNLRVLAIVALFALANLSFHVEAHLAGEAEYSHRFGLAAVILLIMLIGGRIVPSFTRNWLVRENPGRLPVPFDRFDAVALAIGGLALAAWILAPDWSVTGLLLVGAGLVQAARLIRWAGDRTIRDRLVLVLHVGYVFVPLGFLLLGASVFIPTLSPTAGIHAWSVGAIGIMTLAVMTRATRGHTGHALEAPASTQAVYAAVAVAAILRVLAALPSDWNRELLWLAGACWVAAFWGFCAEYGPMLVSARKR